ncbi:TIGR02206 family membrane protein [Sporosarcina oncorhynchi]|uniref:TIGR02206 family membrane protein n=1 Tax=Sporosarcina oncorhynchi TaxID=3056444 RepID=A0ABZ0LA85_9BACL|nr:TIGR02206 family membrane protein [Sporosarcina sp. T2O-4]WOV89013.1 TIGR02206 family membrane protein [Sporosarcina sp. T2O-4]
MDSTFKMFSIVHLAVLVVLFVAIVLLYRFRQNLKLEPDNSKRLERIIAITLLVCDVLYHIWLIQTDRWSLDHSLPLELCSLSLVVTILLLWTGNRHLVDFVIFAGIAGALQAIVTPDLDMNFPHFRFFHFFYTHTGIVMTGLYFIWVKGYSPTFIGAIRTFITLNAILPIIILVNLLFDGNYMFLRRKPQNGSLLDYMGPYPWYILWLEFTALMMFFIIWLVFRKRNTRTD